MTKYPAQRSTSPFVMHNRFIIPLLVAATLAFAKGSAPHKSAAKLPELSREQKKVAVVSSFAVNAGNGVNFRLDVRNNTNKMLELRFRNGQTHDFYVLDSSGKEVYRWSKGKMFTQTVQNRLVKAKESTVFANRMDSSNLHGRYTAVAILTSDNHPVEQRMEFALR